MVKHCRDLHCGSFAPKDSDWCKRHRVDHPQIISGPAEAVRGIEHGYAPGGRLPDTHDLRPSWEKAFTDAGIDPTAASEVPVADWERRLLASGTVSPDGGVERNYTYPDATSHGKHRKDQPARRRTWRHPIRGVISR
jgi:hypothetical protein